MNEYSPNHRWAYYVFFSQHHKDSLGYPLDGCYTKLVGTKQQVQAIITAVRGNQYFSLVPASPDINQKIRLMAHRSINSLTVVELYSPDLMGALAMTQITEELKHGGTQPPH